MSTYHYQAEKEHAYWTTDQIGVVEIILINGETATVNNRQNTPQEILEKTAKRINEGGADPQQLK